MHKINKADARKLLKENDADGYTVISRNSDTVPKMVVGLRDDTDTDYTLVIDEDNLPEELEPVASRVRNYTAEEIAQQDLEGSNPRGKRVKDARDAEQNSNNGEGNNS